MLVDSHYIGLLKNVMSGETIKSRNSLVKRSTDHMIRFQGTPLISIRKTAWKNALREMEFFLSGKTNLEDLDPKVRHWWEEWAEPDGELINIYPKQFRNFNGRYDQLKHFVKRLKKDPYSRRHVMTLWNPEDMFASETRLPCCHGTVIQAHCTENDGIRLSMYQRSVDTVLGLPHNWVQYKALLLWLARETDRSPERFTWIGGDCHVYENAFKTVEAMLEIWMDTYQTIKTPELVISKSKGPFRASDFSLKGDYEPIIRESPKMVV